MASMVQAGTGAPSFVPGSWTGTVWGSDKAGSGGGQGPITNKQSSQQSSKSFFSDPALVQQLSRILGGAAGDTGAQYANFLRDPVSNPLYTNALAGMLGELQPGFQAERAGLADQFRAAGNTGSSTYGDAANRMALGHERNMGGIASQLLTTLFPQMAQALFAPMGQIPNLLNALKLQESQGSSQGTSWAPPQQPGGGGGGSVSFGGSSIPSIFNTPNINPSAPGQSAGWTPGPGQPYTGSGSGISSTFDWGNLNGGSQIQGGGWQ